MAINDRGLEECPDTPNCVSTTTSIERGRMSPIPFSGALEEARELMLSILADMRGVEIIEQKPEYIHATFSSAIFGFVDDVEFVFDSSRKVVNFRSASRTGYYDFGVNRRRMEAISNAFRNVDQK